MATTSSIRFFDAQFQRQLRDAALELNPFEIAALPYLQGRVLDFGCGLGNLALAAAARGCTVVALDASEVAIEHLRRTAVARGLSIEAAVADLRDHEIGEDFDAAVSIGLLMFFDCETASRQLAQLQSCVRPGGVAVVNVLIEGTTFLDMFDPAGCCLFERDALQRRFAGWDLLHCDFQDFAAPGGSVKSFVTLIARKPAVASGTPAADRAP